jgi:hypothetical protein
VPMMIRSSARAGCATRTQRIAASSMIGRIVFPPCFAGRLALRPRLD